MQYFSLLITLICFSSFSAEKENNPVNKKKPEKSDDKQISMAFLSYLAEMTEVDGKLIGPQDMQKQLPVLKENTEHSRNDEMNKQQPEKKSTDISDKKGNDGAVKEEGQSYE